MTTYWYIVFYLPTVKATSTKARVFSLAVLAPTRPFDDSIGHSTLMLPPLRWRPRVAEGVVPALQPANRTVFNYLPQSIKMQVRNDTTPPTANPPNLDFPDCLLFAAIRKQCQLENKSACTRGQICRQVSSPNQEKDGLLVAFVVGSTCPPTYLGSCSDECRRFDLA